MRYAYFDIFFKKTQYCYQYKCLSTYFFPIFKADSKSETKKPIVDLKIFFLIHTRHPSYPGVAIVCTSGEHCLIFHATIRCCEGCASSVVKQTASETHFVHHDLLSSHSSPGHPCSCPWPGWQSIQLWILIFKISYEMLRGIF